MTTTDTDVKDTDTNDIELPLGLNPEDITEDYKARLRDYKVRRPDLYAKMTRGD